MTNFPYKTTKHIRNLILKNSHQKISKQFDIDPRELIKISTPGFNQDPVNDMNFYLGDGIIRKYKNRILLLVTGTCAVNCRYCFRRNFDYNLSVTHNDIEPLISKIQQIHEVDEVILSGGDPLTVSNSILAKLINGLNKCTNLARIRIHSRMLTVSPNRFDKNLINIFEKSDKKIVLVNHINLAEELSSHSRQLVKQLQKSNVTMLNQSVLLKGINDSSLILTELSNQLFNTGILPYYLNILDKTEGAEHFFLELDTVLKIYKDFSESVSGYLLPKLVYDQGDGKSKKILGTFTGQY